MGLVDMGPFKENKSLLQYKMGPIPILIPQYSIVPVFQHSKFYPQGAGEQ